MADGPDRQTELTIDLSEQVNLIRITSSEGLSQHFTTTIELIAPLGEIDFLKHLGKPAAVRVVEDEVEQRFFHGLLADAEFINEIENRGFVYRLTLKPAAYFHSQGRNFRVFQKKTTREIIEAVLDGCNIKKELKNVSGETPTRPYCVQYGESDFGFVSRLMEEDGLYYFYDHSATQHTLTVCNAPSSHVESKVSPLSCIETAQMVDFAGASEGHAKHFLYDWRERVSTGAEQKVTLRDFDFMKPDKVEGEAASEEEYQFEGVEIYNYPARGFDKTVHKQRSEIVLESRRANRRTYVGESKNTAICCGTTFKLKDHSIDRLNEKSYLVTQTFHSIAPETYESAQGSEGGTEIRMEGVPADVKWRAPMRSRRPVVLGPETALVTGPQSDEIWTDEYGRVKIQFHWDREGNLDEESSCWVRVSQTGGLGNLIMPRVGHEVLVDFMDGDPDRPIVVGRVFNALTSNMPVYALPEHKTRALWRSRVHNTKENFAATGQSWVGVPNIGGNELMFEDKKGNEQVVIYGQKDMLTQVQNDVGHHFGNDHEVKIGNNRQMKIGADDTIEIVGNRDTKIQENEKREITGKRETKIAQSELLDVTSDITMKSASTILIKATTSITLECGGSKIEMTPVSIKIKSTMLNTEATTIAEHKGGNSKITMMPGMMMINGTMVMIN